VLGPALTWEDLADMYKKATGSSAKVRPMDEIFEWAEKQPGVVLNERDGTLHKKV